MWLLEESCHGVKCKHFCYQWGRRRHHRRRHCCCPRHQHTHHTINSTMFACVYAYSFGGLRVRGPCNFDFTNVNINMLAAFVVHHQAGSEQQQLTGYCCHHRYRCMQFRRCRLFAAPSACGKSVALIIGHLLANYATANSLCCPDSACNCYTIVHQRLIAFVVFVLWHIAVTFMTLIVFVCCLLHILVHLCKQVHIRFYIFQKIFFHHNHLLLSIFAFHAHLLFSVNVAISVNRCFDATLTLCSLLYSGGCYCCCCFCGVHCLHKIKCHAIHVVVIAIVLFVYSLHLVMSS